jgi:glucose-1-phosphate thymidylyltransferase
MTNALKIAVSMTEPTRNPNPHILGRPPQLMRVAGKPLLEHVLSTFKSLPKTLPREYVIITREHSQKIQSFIHESFPTLKSHFAEQTDRLGTAHGLYQAREILTGPVLFTTTDSFVETDLGFLSQNRSTAVAWVREVADPGQAGFAVQNTDGWVSKIQAHPQKNGRFLAVTGMYYLPDGQELVDAIEEQIVNDRQTNGVFTIEEAINILLARGLRMRTEEVSAWLAADGVTPLLETNAYLLETGHANFTNPTEADGVSLIPPVYIDPTAQIEGSIIGPNVSIEAGCRIEGSVIRNSIICKNTKMTGCNLKDSVIGRRTMVEGVSGIINIGDGANVTSPTLPGDY